MLGALQTHLVWLRCFLILDGPGFCPKWSVLVLRMGRTARMEVKESQLGCIPLWLVCYRLVHRQYDVLTPYSTTRRSRVMSPEALREQYPGFYHDFERFSETYLDITQPSRNGFILESITQQMIIFWKWGWLMIAGVEMDYKMGFCPR